MSTALARLVVVALAGQVPFPDVSTEPLPNRPKVPGVLRLHTRQREPDKFVERTVEWKLAETAIIIIDMWDGHYCRSAAQRLGVMVPRMNEVVTSARAHGVMIIHAPSGCMDIYADTPYRRRMREAPAAEAPKDWNFKKWADLDPAREPPMPVETKECSCDDPVVGAAVRRFYREHPGLDIIGYDGISDSGQEIWNFCQAEGIKNIVIMGVHTNMCVLGRPFGIRANVKLGRNVVLVRDLTDAMYDPRQPPHVSHARGTEMVIEHIEKYWCPTILAEDLTKEY